MRILFFFSGFKLAGKEYVDLAVVKGLKELGHEVVVVYIAWNDGQFADELKRMDIEHYPLKFGWYYLTKIKWSFDSLVHYPAALKKFISIKNQLKPDVFYFDSYRNILLVKPFISGKTIFHVHDAHAQSRSLSFFIKRLNSKVDKYISVSDFIKNDLVSIGVDKDKIETIHNGVDYPELADGKPKVDKVFNIGIVGQVSRRKGLDNLLNACKLLPSDIDYLVHVFGDDVGGFVGEMKSLASKLNIYDKVIWHGYEKQKSKIYTSLDVVVIPTLYEEALGLNSLEAAMYGVPVIAYKSGGLPEGVVEGVTGYVLDKREPEEVAKKITYLYSNNSVLSRLSNSAKKHALSHFSTSAMVDKVNKLLVSL